MRNSMLCQLVKIYQSGNMSVFEEIYDEFKRLVLYYGSHLNFDESVQELNVFIVEILYKIPLNQFIPDDSYSLKKYIAVSIRNKYIALSKAKSTYERENIEYIDAVIPETPGFEDNILLKMALSNLSKKQQTVIYMRYIYGYSEIEISTYMGISRQAVNRLINRGFLLLKNLYL